MLNIQFERMISGILIEYNFVYLLNVHFVIAYNDNDDNNEKII